MGYEWISQQWQGMLAGFAFAGVLIALLAWALFVWQQRRWQQNVADELEEKIQQRTLELQITLNELADKNRQLEQQNTLDALTGIRNRAFFDQKLIAELKRCRRERSYLSLLMIDIDHFKAINDQHGHLVGDAVIQQVAQCIQSHLKRSSDHLCRYGGEEFALILPNTNSEGAMQLAELVRQDLASSQVNYQQLALLIHASIGCYTAIPEPQQTSSDFIQAADAALYQAKHTGRNKVVCSELSQHEIAEQEPESDDQDQ
ncbi:GGDEF domain-containing protein [Rheinheimera marina]|uniref:diguanylate cyclase n=1 Tax=Rheinheimera marina TaxID=1774958 RepID=A0ABV9JG18_9GAMM